MKTQAFLDAVAAGLNKEPGSISLSDTTETVQEWDSIGHLSIIATVDSQLGVSTDEEAFRNFTSIKQLVDTLKLKGALED